MFDIGFSELLVIAIIALVVMGPERLPETVRTISLWLGRMKQMFSSARQELENEVGMDEIRRQLHNEKIMRDLDAAKENIEATVIDTQAAIDKEISDAKIAHENELSDARAELDEDLEDPADEEQDKEQDREQDKEQDKAPSEEPNTDPSQDNPVKPTSEKSDVWIRNSQQPTLYESCDRI